MGLYVQNHHKIFTAPLSVVTSHGVSPQVLLNVRFRSNPTDRITPYFRNYTHSRRKLGLFLRYSLCAVFAGRSTALTYRERFFAYWIHQRAQTAELVRAHATVPLPRLAKFQIAGLRRQYQLSALCPPAPACAFGYLPTSRFGLNPQTRLRQDYTLLGLIPLKAFLFPIWANALRLCTRKRLGLAFRANSYFNTLVPTFAFKVALDSGSVARGRQNRYVYSEWIRRMPRHSKLYNRKRILGRKYARLLWGVKRLRFFISMCEQLRAVTNRLSRFRRLFYFKLITFIASAFRIGSPTRVLMLIRAGHVFVNGQCVRNPKFQLSALDVVSFSKIARPWVRRLRRLLSFRKRSRARTGPRRRWRARVFRRAAQRFVVLGPKSSFAVVRSVRSMPHPVTLRGLDRKPYMASGRIRFLLGTLQY